MTHAFPRCSSGLVSAVAGALVAIALGSASSGRAAESQWAWWGATGHVVYRPDAQGGRVMDFSNVGYRAGKAAIPDVPTVVTVSAGAGDDTARVQAAIDQVAALPLGPDGFRGAVLLKNGSYDIEGQIKLNASGIVLRGESRWEGGTVLHARGTSQRALISISGSGSRVLSGSTISIVDKTVPVGMNSFRVASTTGLAVGDTILVTRPSPANWIHDIGMDQLDNPWQPDSKNLNWERTITRIEGNRVFFDAPLTNSLQQQYGGGTLRKFTYPGRIENVGVENLRGESDYASNTDENHSWDFVSIGTAQNAWVRETKALYFAYAHVNIGSQAKWVTVSDAINHSPKSLIEGGRRYAFNINGQQNLVTGCESRDGRHDYVFGSSVAGPNVFHRSVAINANADTGPHHRWSTGGLFDNITSDGEINAENRWNWGTGHGWAGANMVVWNSQAAGYRVESPPTAQNWVIGSQGAQRTPDFQSQLGPHPPNYDSHNTNVTPDSLYEAQTAAAAPLREYRWQGGAANWADQMRWDQRAVPAYRTIQSRDYLIGDVDGFTYDGNADDDYYVDPAFKARVAPSSTHESGGFDVLTDNRYVAFTQQYQLGPTEQIVHATLALAIRPNGGQVNGWDNDTLEIDGVGQFSLNALGWTRRAGATDVGVFDLGPYLPVVQTGQISAALREDTAADFAILSLTAAVETPDALGAAVWIEAGGQVTVNSRVPSIGQLAISGAGTRLSIPAGGELGVMRSANVDAALQVAGGLLDVSGGTVAVGNAANGTLDIAGGRLVARTVVLGNGSAGTLNLDQAGALQAATIRRGTGAATLNWNDGTIRNLDATTDLTIPSGVTIKIAALGAHNFDISSGRTATVAATLGDATAGGTLHKTGAGTLTLTGANTYSGVTRVEAGRLKVAGSIRATAGATVAPAAVLELAGAAASATAAELAVANEGTLLVSTANQELGSVTGTGVLQINSGASLTVDHIAQAILSINADARVTISSSGESTTSVVNVLHIAGWGSSASVTESGGASDSSASPGDDGAAAVPEPATWLLALLGLVASIAVQQSTALRQRARRA